MKKKILSILLAVCLLIGALPMTASAATVTERESNDTTGTAQSITVNDTVSGNISTEGDVDFYKFTLTESGRVNIIHTAHSKYYGLYLYDANKMKLWETDAHEWQSSVGFQTGEFDLDLLQGTYYLRITGAWQSWDNAPTSTGEYTCNLQFDSSNVNHVESNDSLETAAKISLNSRVNGLIAINNSKDFYSFKISKTGSVNILYTTHTQRYSLHIYNADGVEEWSESDVIYGSAEFFTEEYKINLEAGIYYLCIMGNTGGPYDRFTTGNYNFSITTDGSTPDPEPTPTPDPGKVAVTGVSLNKSSLELKEGETAALTATVAPANASNKAVTWSSSDASVATVTSGGTVKAVSEGTATVTVRTSDGGYTARCTVKVVSDGEAPYVTSFSVNGVSGVIDGSSKKITVTLPEEADYYTFRATTSPSEAKAVLWLDSMSTVVWGAAHQLTRTPPFYFTLEVGDTTKTEYQVEVKVASSKNDTKFNDVSSNSWYYESVLWAVENNVTGGTSPTTFSPNDSCTRAQAVTFLWRAAGQPEPSSSYNPFRDVKSSAYYYDAVLWAVENGVTGGTSLTTFSPNDTCTRAQIVTFLWRQAGKPAWTAAEPFADVSQSAYYFTATEWARYKEIIGGYGNNDFRPNNYCNRAEIVKILHGYYN